MQNQLRCTLAHRFCRTSPGSLIHYTISTIGLLMVVIVMIFSLSLTRANMARDMLEDGLAAALLAAAVPDTRELARNGQLYISDPVQAAANYKSALVTNLGLTSSLQVDHSSYITGRVEALYLTLYNVRDSQVEIFHLDPVTGVIMESSSGSLGFVTTPNGKTVTQTTLYAQIGVYVKNFSIRWPGVASHNTSQYVTLDKAVDLALA